MARAALSLLLGACASSTGAPTAQLVDVALGKPVLDAFSGSGESATSPAPAPPVGWFTTAFAASPDHALYPETLLIDLLAVFNISAVEFSGDSARPPRDYAVFTGLPGEPFWRAVAPLSATAFAPVAARYVRLVVTAVAAAAPNYTVSVGRVRVLGLAAPLPAAPVPWPPPPRPAFAARAARLMTERRVEPIDVDAARPLLSWVLESGARGDAVTAWQVVLNRSGAVLWDSGRVAGAAFSCEAAPSAPLAAGDALAWSVRLWDAVGVATAWAPAATFQMAKRAPADWGAQWVGADAASVVAGAHGPGHPAVYLRGSFELRAPPARAVASFAGLGYGKLFVDGAEASALELSPGFTTYELRTQFNVLDVTRLLARPGRVTLAAILGDGWYALAHDPSCCARFQFQPYVNSTRMLLDLDLWFADGSHERVSSGASWQWALGEVTSSWLAGESVDKARALPANWTTDFAPTMPDSTWRPVALLDGPPALFNGSVLTAQKEPSTLRGALFSPQTVRVAPEPNATDGALVYIFDLGREVQGRPVVTAAARGAARLRIVVCGSFYLRRAFTCDEGTATALNAGEGPSLYNFSLAGTGANETYEPLFTYAAVTRVVVHVPAGVGAPALSVRMIAMEQPAAGAFATSDDTYNWLHAALARTQVHYTTGFPNDPSRERVGYTQDAMNMFRGAAFEFASSELLYSRWITDFLDGQAYARTHPGTGIPAGAGQMPTVVPGPKSDNANSVFWGGALVWLPWRHFLHYGDARVLERAYDGMAAYVDYLDATAPDHLVRWGLADWNSPLPQCSGWGFDAAPVINTPGLYALSRATGQIAALLGRAADAARFAALADATAAAYNAAFLNASSGAYSTGQQCHQSMALAQDGLVPAAARAAAVATLVARVAADNATLTIGFVSFLHEVLALADADPALLHAIVTRRNYGPEQFTNGCADRDGPGGRPSTAWGCAPGPYSMSVGAAPSNDLMKESWQGADAMMPSLAGPLLVHSYHVLAGVRVAETLAGAGFRNFSILPSPVPALLWLNSTVDSPLGDIVVNWRAAPPAFYLEVVVPPGASALVGVPSASARDAVLEGGRPVAGAWRGGRAYVQVGSGQFFYESTLPPRGGGEGGSEGEASG